MTRQQAFRLPCAVGLAAFLHVILGFGVTPLRAQLVISELLASNVETNFDEDGDSSDWVELKNIGPTSLDIGGYELSNDELGLGRWTLPSVTLPPGGRVLVWCSGKDRRQVGEQVEQPAEPVAHWPLDEGAGEVFANLVDPATNGFLASAGVQIQWIDVDAGANGLAPLQDRAVRFTGTDSWIQTEFEGIGGSRPRTVSFWLRTTASNTHGIVAWGNSGANGAKWHVRLNDNSGNGILGALRTEPQGGQNVATRVINDGQWHHVASVFPDGATSISELRHYVDGDLDPQSGGGDQTVNTQVGAGAEPVTIGARVQGSNRHFFPGDVADVRIYDVALEEEEIEALLAGDPLPPRVSRSFLHTDFALDADGEWLILYKPQGDVADAVQFPEQVTDQSYGRLQDGLGAFAFFLTPTPGEPNSGPSSTEPLIVADTKFDPNRGFYSDPFTVEISTATPDAIIRYTLDGSAPTETAGELYTGPIDVRDTTTLRAAAFKEGLRPTNVDTHTYIFLETADGGGVLHQPARPPGFPSTWGSRTADYEMDPRVVSDTASRFHDPRVREGLLSMPSLSIVMDLYDLFDPAEGIYSNSQQHGDFWERPTSVELIYPDGSRGFQVNAGLRIQGNASRNPNRPKHNMRVAFRREYGPGRLNYPFFEDSPNEDYDTLILRGGNGDSWFHPNTSQQIKAQYIRDQWHRDVQQRMGRLTAHQVYMHLYINGLYWGVYHIFERPNAEFLSAYLEGEEEEFDAINGGELIDGNLQAWNQLWSIASAGVASPAGYATIQEYLDVPNLIDFLLINYYSGNVDWDRKNWYGGRRRIPGAGYKFFVWDSERTFWNLTENRTTLNLDQKPTGIHQRLRANEEYRLRFADHVQRHFFDDGVLTPGSAAALWNARAEEIITALASESARWGDDERPAAPYTVDEEWTTELESLRRNWFPRRSDIVLDQLKAQGLYPPVTAPDFNRHGGHVPAGFEVTIAAPEGVVYYTLDGSDPRLPGGDLSPVAIEAGSAPRTVLSGADSGVRILVPTDGTLGASWTETDFDDSSWRAGSGGVGYERNSGYQDLIAVDVEPDMYETNGSVYVRKTFTVDDPSAFSGLELRVKYDDGFVAYLNGVRVAGRNAPDEPQWNSTATSGHADAAAILFETVELPAEAMLAIQPGENVLAFHGLNISASSGDMLLIAELGGFATAEDASIPIDTTTLVRSRAFVDGVWSALTEATFVRNDLRVTEIMYHPLLETPAASLDEEDFAYLELRNVGSEPLQLGGVRIEGDVSFAFDEGTITTLAPGEFIVLVEDLRGFEFRYGLAGRNVAGQYVGRLSNRGGTLRLVGSIGEVIQEFTFDDAWYPVTDGEGFSLVIADENGALEAWSRADGWKPSDGVFGSPGEEENASGGLQRPGDANQDGAVDVGDAVRLLLLLFDSGGLSLPCGGDLSSSANVASLDFNSDAAVEMSDAVHLLVYLFRNGPAHILGERCTRIEGCEDACVR